MTREHVYKLRDIVHKAAISLSDTDALEAVEMFPLWATGVAYAVDQRVRFASTGKLYRCVQAHTSQEGWEPPNVPALFTEVAKPGQGDSPSNPIPYDNNMQLYSGKYYSQSGVVYRCFRDTGVPVYNYLADLIGIYVEVVA